MPHSRIVKVEVDFLPETKTVTISCTEEGDNRINHFKLVNCWERNVSPFVYEVFLQEEELALYTILFTNLSEDGSECELIVSGKIELTQ